MRAHPDPSRRQQGVSLVELLVTLAVLAILLAGSAPAWSQFIARQSLVSATNSLVTGLQLARYRAISSGQPTRLCAARDAFSCGDNSDWSYGWRVQPDGKTLPVTASEHGLLPAQTKVSLSQGRQAVRFLPDGRSPGTNLTLQLCSRNRALRQIIVSNGGRTRITPILDTPC